MRFVATMREIGDDHENQTTKTTKRRARSSQQSVEDEMTETLEDSASAVVEEVPRKRKRSEVVE